MADESYQVKAILTAYDEGFTKGMKNAQKSVQGLGKTASGIGKVMKGGFGFGVAAGIGQKAFGAITSGIGEVVSTLSGSQGAWKTFEGNMKSFGKSDATIGKVQKSMQQYAAKTIYSASDMASTYSQFAAVGVKNTTSLVKGFGGLAAAAENPAQAMKTLSQQGTQMAAKPMVQWADFKLMLEQTPAGISKIAEAMGMTTKQLVKDVQDGKVKTDDFFKAVEKAGNTKSAQKMATQFKTVGEAMDGLYESAANALMPVWNEVTQVGIDALAKLGDAVGNFDGEKIAEKVKPAIDAIKDIGSAFSEGGLAGGLSEIQKQISGAGGQFQKFAALAASAFAVGNLDTFKSALEGVASVPVKLSSGFSSAKGSITGLKNSFPTLAAGADKAKEAMKGMGNMASFMVKNNARIKFPTLAKGIDTFAGKLSSLTGKVGGVSGEVVGLINGAVGQILGLIGPAAIVGVIVVALGAAYNAFGGQIDSILALAQSKGPEIITNLGNGIVSAIPSLMEKGTQMLSGLMSAITANIPAIVSTGADIIASLVSGLGQALPTLIPQAARMVVTLAGAIVQNIPKLLAAGMKLLAGLAQGIAQAIPVVIQAAPGIISRFVSGLKKNFPSILESGKQILTSLGTGIKNGLATLIGQVPGIFKGLGDAITSIDWATVGVKILKVISKGVVSGITALGKAIGSLFSNLGDWLKGGESGGKKTGEGVKTGLTSSSGGVKAAGNSLGKSASSGIKSGMNGASTSASQSVSKINSSLSKGAGKAKTSGSSMGKGFSSGVKSGMTSASSSASQSVSKTSSTMSKGSSKGKSAGKKMGTGYATGLKSGMSKAPSYAAQMNSKVAARIRSGRGAAHSAGAYVGAGVASGLNSQVGAVTAAANRIIAQVNRAMRAKAKIHSPSRLTRPIGIYLAEGLNVGMKKRAKKLKASAKTLVADIASAIRSAAAQANGAFSSMMGSLNISWAGGNYSDAAKNSASAYESSIKSQVAAQEKAYKSNINKAYNAQKKKYKKSGKGISKNEKKVLSKMKTNGSKLLEKYKNSIESNRDQAIDAVTNALTALGDAYQSKYDDLASKRNDLFGKLSETGDLFESDDYGYVQLKDFTAANKQINKYGANLMALKGKIPSGLMDKIVGMDVQQGLTYTNKLLSMGASELSTYGQQYQKFLDDSTRISKQFYQNDLNKIKLQFDIDWSGALANLQKQLATIGTNVTSGFAKGISQKKSQKKVKKATKKTAKTSKKSTKKHLKSHSPSRVFASIGGDTIQGFVNGIIGMQRQVKVAIGKTIAIPNALTPQLEGGLSSSLSSDFDYYTNAHYTVTVPVNLDGKQVAKVTAPYTQEELNKRVTRSNRRHGVL